MRRDSFTFGSVSSGAYWVILVSGGHTVDAPERDITTVEVPGRNGSLVYDNGRYKDIDITYSCAIVKDFESNFQKLRNDLLKQTGYVKLTDTIHPNEYRQGVFKGAIQPTTTPYNAAGTFDLTFTCKPQRFLNSGSTAIALSASGQTVQNDYMPSLPLITVTGSGAGTLTVGTVKVQFTSSFAGPVTLDCDTQNAYNGATNKNSQISAPTFPVLPSGSVTVTWSGGVKSVSIVPRWWIL